MSALLNPKDKTIIRKVNKTAKVILLSPGTTHTYNDIITSKKVAKGTIMALNGNTYRGFHMIDKSKQGSGYEFKSFFLTERQYVLKELRQCASTEHLDDLLDNISDAIRIRLRKNINNNQLASYNKVRKPVDIVIEHIVSMGSEISEKQRQNLVPLLRLPLDSQMFKNELVFPKEHLRLLSIRRSFTFQSISSKEHYHILQDYLVRRSKSIGNNFYPIYFDLLWNNRYLKKGNCLGELN